MSGTEVAIFILAVFLAGVALGVVGMVSVAIRKEDHRFSSPAPRPPQGCAAHGN